jgi:DNA-directed RNA polymerase specialized sigma24 family protein
MVDCRDVASYGSLALDQYLPSADTMEIRNHINECGDCANFIGHMAKTRALLGFHPGDPAAPRSRHDELPQAADSEYSSMSLMQMQGHLMTLACAADPAHAEDLVQETWDHFFGTSPSVIPSREVLAAHLLQHITEHEREEETENQAWADSLLRHHRHHTADSTETDPSARPATEKSLRALAELDALDPDAERAELYFPDLYDDGPDKGEWITPPVAWPTMSHILTPDDETRTAELYSIVDSALDELPGHLGDAVYLIDIEGHSLTTASSLLQREAADIQRDLAQARNHVRGRVNDYLATDAS